MSRIGFILSHPIEACGKFWRGFSGTLSNKEGGYRPVQAEPLQVSCSVQPHGYSELVFVTSAQELLEELGATRKRFERPELEGQRARLRRAIRRRSPFKLNDDPFGLTSYAFAKLFEQGKATMKLGGKTFRFSDLTKEEWREGKAPRAFYGGFLYRDSAGVVIFKRGTWIS